jgi:O-succinylbenzoic acid--CoA ligase
MFQLSFQDQTFRTPADFSKQESNLPDFVKSTFTFCANWLVGNQTFEQLTSGSTGIPKKISLDRSQMTESAKATQGFFKTDEHTKLLCCLNPEFIAGKMMLVRAMVWNSEIELVEPNSNPLLNCFQIPDFVAMVPLQAANSLSGNESLVKLLKINNLIIGGAPIPEKLKSELLKNKILAYQTYGMTETVSHIALASITSRSIVYHTLPGVRIGVDERQALWIESPMSGSNPIQTNDQVELLSNSTFRWLGRVDFVINSGGVKIHPELLEQKAAAIINEFYPCSDFFFIGIKDEKLGEKVCLLVEVEKPDMDSARELKHNLESILCRFENPKEIFFVEKFVRTPTGKINRLQTAKCL